MNERQRILEGVVTTTNPDGTTNIAPMGPMVDDEMSTLRLRPYQTSTTYQNLKRTTHGVFHVTDDVLLLAQAAVNELAPPPHLISCEAVEGHILADACRWYAFRVTSLDDRDERTDITATVVGQGHQRDFFGFKRAKHAVIEAAILATRIEFLPAESILSDFQRLKFIVDKTAGDDEVRAFQLLSDYVQAALTTKTD